MSEKRNVPKLRFKPNNRNNYDDYTEENIYNFLIESKISAEDNINKRLTVKLNLKGIYRREPNPMEKEGATKQYVRKSGQFIYGKQNLYKGAFGLIPPELDGYLSSTDIPSFDFKGNINPLWFFYYFSRKDFYESLEKFSTGTGSKRIHPKDFLKIKIKVPNSIEEQIKVAGFLSKVDKRKNLLKLKLKKYINFKKYLLQQLFTQKLRFKEFNDEWKIFILKDLIIKGKAGGTPKSTNPKYYGGKIPFLSIKDMTKQGKYIQNTEKHITKDGLENSSAWVIPKNSILYSIYASVGSVAINLKEISTSQAIYGMIFKKDVFVEYIYYYLLNYKKNIHKYIETGTQGNINAKILKSFKIELPKINEQIKIGKFLLAVDKKIDLIQNQIELTEKYKKGLLQQMFI